VKKIEKWREKDWRCRAGCEHQEKGEEELTGEDAVENGRLADEGQENTRGHYGNTGKGPGEVKKEGGQQLPERLGKSTGCDEEEVDSGEAGKGESAAETDDGIWE